ncbi:hypothetical protein SKAU_G00320050 [Synaphobranchus kaupii]|uniref:Uncharacterized protein n=1 Tax=Synaphobranchus kaupii TaxID=118154 RepID=A0A9Q1IJG5_SYNKA|nr:hypothetical protein SKAU_G00320050 [Synaphobranchus kaupii]
MTEHPRENVLYLSVLSKCTLQRGSGAFVGAPWSRCSNTRQHVRRHPHFSKSSSPESWKTVLKSAMYEITRLVEDSFLEEAARSQTGSRGLEAAAGVVRGEPAQRARGAAGDRGVSTAAESEFPARGQRTDDPQETQSGVEEGCGLKQEKLPEESWSSCPGEGLNPGPPNALEEEATPSSIRELEDEQRTAHRFRQRQTRLPS